MTWEYHGAEAEVNPIVWWQRMRFKKNRRAAAVVRSWVLRVAGWPLVGAGGTPALREEAVPS